MTSEMSRRNTKKTTKNQKVKNNFQDAEYKKYK